MDEENPSRRRPNDRPEVQAGGRRGGLGRGLSSLIPTAAAPVAPSAPNDSPLSVPIDAVEPNPYQPRGVLNPDQLETLAESIRQHGVVQPLIVNRSPEPGRYVLIAGERRWRAARMASLANVPVVVKDTSPQHMLELALVENVVRADLSPLEEAAAYRQLIEEFGLTQASVAQRVGRSRVSVTNTLRLLAAPDGIQAALAGGEITEGHARALLGLGTSADQLVGLRHVIDRGLSVRQTEEMVRRWLDSDTTGPRADRPTGRDIEEVRLEDRFRGALNTKVAFKRRGPGKGGTLTIQYFSDEELDALYRRLNGEDIW
ncbi:MAG: Chromosome (plasmid) partitioning protein ParB [uncultured Thermomicrobiales bacterium]|uniref:Chromosome (Plasmid) partitioning protein ParB n=1 Tax=uncultured Thermomicrobiales bacterium TaxID=1645740 RepID=A0A6J4U5Z1_9BACT|nr:MAG: Chromosome (plasmid) partitioning protein ParB [uncultured Thermomicrobiales bacterium]